MNSFSIDFTLNELTFIRQSLEVVSISGKDAKFLANLQIKVEQEIQQIQTLLQEEEVKKKQELQNIIIQESKKSNSK